MAEWSLTGWGVVKLQAKSKTELRRLCEERNISINSVASQEELVNALLNWKKTEANFGGRTPKMRVDIPPPCQTPVCSPVGSPETEFGLTDLDEHEPSRLIYFGDIDRPTDQNQNPQQNSVDYQALVMSFLSHYWKLFGSETLFGSGIFLPQTELLFQIPIRNISETSQGEQAISARLANLKQQFSFTPSMVHCNLIEDGSIHIICQGQISNPTFNSFQKQFLIVLLPGSTTWVIGKIQVTILNS